MKTMTPIIRVILKRKWISVNCTLHAILHTVQYAKIEVENWSLCRSEKAHNTYSCFLNIVYAKVGLARHQYRILTFSLIIDKGGPLVFTESLSQSSFWRKTSSPERVIARGTSNVTVTTVCTDQQVTLWELPVIKENRWTVSTVHK